MKASEDKDQVFALEKQWIDLDDQLMELLKQRKEILPRIMDFTRSQNKYEADLKILTDINEKIGLLEIQIAQVEQKLKSYVDNRN